MCILHEKCLYTRKLQYQHLISFDYKISFKNFTKHTHFKKVICTHKLVLNADLRISVLRAHIRLRIGIVNSNNVHVRLKKHKFLTLNKYKLNSPNQI